MMMLRPLWSPNSSCMAVLLDMDHTMMCRAPCGTTGLDVRFARVPWITAPSSASGQNDSRGRAAACLTDIAVRPHLVDFLARLECMRQPSVEWFVYSANVSVNIASFLERLLPMVAQQRRTMMSLPEDDDEERRQSCALECNWDSAPAMRRQSAWNKVLLAPFVATEQYSSSSSPALNKVAVPLKSLSCVLLPSHTFHANTSCNNSNKNNNGDDTGITATPKLPLERRNCHDWFSLPVIIDDRVDVLTCADVSMCSTFLVNPFVIDSSSDDVTFHPNGPLAASLRALHTYCALSAPAASTSSTVAATRVSWRTFWGDTATHSRAELNCAYDPYRERRNSARTAFLAEWEEVHQQCQTRSLIASLVSF